MILHHPNSLRTDRHSDDGSKRLRRLDPLATAVLGGTIRGGVAGFPELTRGLYPVTFQADIDELIALSKTLRVLSATAGTSTPPSSTRWGWTRVSAAMGNPPLCWQPHTSVRIYWSTS